MKEEKLEEIITVVEENLDYLDRCSHSDNCEMSGIVLGKNRDKVKNWIREIIEGNSDGTDRTSIEFA